MKPLLLILTSIAIVFCSGSLAFAQVDPEVQETAEKARQQALLPLRVSVGDGEGGEGRDLTAAIEVVLFLSLLTLLPSLVLTVTCFTRVVIVLSFVRRAMATPRDATKCRAHRTRVVSLCGRHAASCLRDL